MLCKAQTNLVYNGSFEDYSNCPTIEDQLPYCIGWMKANLSTVDYVNACAPISGGVNSPFYFYGGYQEPFQGDAYCGIGCYYQSDTTVCEYIQTKLIEKLKPRHAYRLSFYIVLGNHSVYAINNFGAYLSENRPSSVNYSSFNHIPQLISGFITDTLNWVKVSQTIIANGEEEYLTIGRFDYNEIQLQTVSPDTNPFFPDTYGYYLVDSVSLFDVSDLNTSDYPCVFTPNNDGLNDLFFITALEYGDKYEIYNRWGIKVFEASYNTGWDGRTSAGFPCSDGVYYYIAKRKDKEAIKGFIQLIR